HAAEAAATEKAASEAACHEAPAPEPKEGDACPMHHGSQGRAHNCCAMSNACDGPGSHLASLLAFVGIPEAPQTAAIAIDIALAPSTPPPPPLLRVSTPDAPPPKH
ncbi:MAG: hypothetical protein ACKOEC_16010, partial [Acidimicrobiia bacterium]